MSQNPEQLACDETCRQLLACGWIIQNKNAFNLSAGSGVDIREEEGVKLTMTEDQSTEYAAAKFKYINNDRLRFVHESTGKFISMEQYQIIQEIESRLSVCDKIEETITDRLKQVETLQQSILKKAFDGKLT